MGSHHQHHKEKSMEEIEALKKEAAEDYLTGKETVAHISKKYKLGYSTTSRAIVQYFRERDPELLERLSNGQPYLCEKLRESLHRTNLENTSTNSSIDAKMWVLQIKIAILEDHVRELERKGPLRRLLSKLF